MRMFDRVVVALWGIEDLRDDHQDVALSEVELGVVTVAQAPGRRDDRIEHGLEPLRARHRSEDLPYRPLLLAQVLVLPNELLELERLAASHPADSRASAGAQGSLALTEPAGGCQDAQP